MNVPTDFESLFNNMSETYGVVEIIYDSEGRMIDCLLREANRAFERAVGLPRDQFINRRARDFMLGTPELDTYLAAYAEVDRTGRAVQFDASYPPQNLHFRVSAFPLGAHRVGVLSIDTTERVLAQQKLRELTAELVRAEEMERARIADILHDDLQQILVAAKYAVSGMDAQPRDEQSRTVHMLTDMLGKAIETSRFVTTALRPPALYELGVGAAFFWLAEDMKKKHGLTVDLHIDAAAEPSTMDTRIFVFQAVREMLLNIVKHSGVRLVHVRMELTPQGHLRVDVTDEGAGFVAAKGSSRGFGLFSIRERSSLMGGHLDIRTAAGQGTTISLTLPRA